MKSSRLPLLILILCLLTPTVWLSGCYNSRIAAENDRLRAEVLSLKQKRDDLRQSNMEMEAQLVELSQNNPAVSSDVQMNTPQVTEIRIGRLSHVRDDDRDGSPDRAMVYLKPIDGRGRFVQLAGRLTVNIARVPDNGDPNTVGSKELDPALVREAYRAGLIGGAHYTVEIPLEKINELKDQRYLLWAVYKDGRSGRQLRAERTVQFP